MKVDVPREQSKEWGVSVGRAGGQLAHSVVCAKALASASHPGSLPVMLACGASLRLTEGYRIRDWQLEEAKEKPPCRKLQAG